MSSYKIPETSTKKNPHNSSIPGAQSQIVTFGDTLCLSGGGSFQEIFPAFRNRRRHSSARIPKSFRPPLHSTKFDKVKVRVHIPPSQRETELPQWESERASERASERSQTCESAALSEGVMSSLLHWRHAKWTADCG